MDSGCDDGLRVMRDDLMVESTHGLIGIRDYGVWDYSSVFNQ